MDTADASLLPALADALVVAQTASVTEAARRLHKTPSAVSQQLRRIEQHFGVALFEKAGRRLRPTSAGEAALGALTRVFDEATSLATLLGELAGAPVSTLRIAASDYLGEALLIPVMRTLVRDRVPLRFEMTTTYSTEAARLVNEGQVDVAMASSDRAARPGEATLFSQPFFWIAPREPAASGKGRRVRPRPLAARLADEPVLRLSAGSFGRRMLDEYLGRKRIRPASTIDLPSVSLLVAYVDRGLGVGLAPGLAVERLDGARAVLERADVPALDVRLLLRPLLRRTAAVQRFLRELDAEAQRARARLASRLAKS